jgi:hypothetical protein
MPRIIRAATERRTLGAGRRGLLSSPHSSTKGGRRNAYSVACLLIATTALAQATHGALFLDLTTSAVRRMDQSKTVGCGSGGGVFTSGTAQRPPQLTVTLDLEWLNQDHFRLGDHVVADVRLTNTGHDSITLPWNPDSDVVYGKDCRDLEKPRSSATLVGSLILKVVDSDGRARPIGGHELFALRDNPTTYRVLAPGQSARIRVDGRMYVSQGMTKSASAGATDHFKVVATLDLSDSSLPNAYQTVVSANSMDVTTIGM